MDWKKMNLSSKFSTNKEYRYGCSIDCGGTPLRVYERTLGSQGSWSSVEDYMQGGSFTRYNDSSDYAWLPGHYLSELEPPGEGDMYYQDSFGVQVVGYGSSFVPARELPGYLDEDEGLVFTNCELVLTFFAFGVSSGQLGKNSPTQSQKKETPFSKCLNACRKLDNQLKDSCEKDHQTCLKSGKSEAVCDQALSDCMINAVMVSAGCFRRCHDIPGSPPKPKIPVPGLPLKPDIPTEDYDKCYPNWKDKIKDLPVPPKTKK